MVCMRLKPPSPIAWPCENAKPHLRAGKTIRLGRLAQIFIDVVQPRSGDRMTEMPCWEVAAGRDDGEQALPLLVGFLLPPQPQCLFISVPIWSTLHQRKAYIKGDRLSCLFLSSFIV